MNKRQRKSYSAVHAIRLFTRHLGFRRTGPTLDETARSLINGLLREGSLEKNGPNEIRRV